jgi:hypothetical protein
MSSFDRFKNLNFTPLDSHKRQRKVLKGAFADLPNMRNRSWLNQVLPELIWVALIRNQLDLYAFTDAFRSVAYNFARHGITDVTLTGISRLPGDKKAVAIFALTSSIFLRRTLRPMLLFGEYLPDFRLWSDAIAMPVDYTEDAAILAETVVKTIDHQSQESTDCRWFRVVPLLLGNKIYLPSEMREDILSYPYVPDMRKTRPSIRSLEMACDNIHGDNTSPSQWCDDFWTTSFEATECLAPRPSQVEDRFSPSDYEEFIALQRKKLEYIRRVNEKHLPNIKLDVLTGAGLFALKILEELKDSPATSGILGRVAARTLTEVVINITYLTEKNDDEAWNNFYFHGQGEAKKIFLKYMRQNEKPAFIELSDIWLIANEARYMEFLDINLGDWDDANLRNRAIEADLKNFYDTYYDWPSNYTHGTWAAIRREVYTPCQNPLHKFHLLPASDVPNDYGSVMSEALYLTKFILANVYEVYSDLEFHKLLQPGPTSAR